MYKYDYINRGKMGLEDCKKALIDDLRSELNTLQYHLEQSLKWYDYQEAEIVVVEMQKKYPHAKDFVQDSWIEISEMEVKYLICNICEFLGKQHNMIDCKDFSFQRGSLWEKLHQNEGGHMNSKLGYIVERVEELEKQYETLLAVTEFFDTLHN